MELDWSNQEVVMSMMRTGTLFLSVHLLKY